MFYLSLAGVLTAQIENRELIAHYPLMGDLVDATGLNDDLTIFNIEIRDSAVYADGANSNSDTANRINGFIPTLDLDDVLITLEFKLDSIPDDNLRRSIIVGGSGWRWLSAVYTQQTKQIRLGYNNFTQTPEGFDFEYDRWYKLTLTYQRQSQTGRLLIDDVEIASAQFDMDHNNDRTILLDCFCGHHAMRGLWRNLKIFGRDTTQMPLTTECYVEQFPSGEGTQDGIVKTVIKGGTAPYVLTSTQDNFVHDMQVESDTVTISGLRAEMVEIGVADQSGQTSTCTVELPAPQTDLVLRSHYPLVNDLTDVLEAHEDLVNTNVDLLPGEGLFSEGLPNGADTFNQIQTRLTELDLDDFYISLEVKLDSITDDQGRNAKNIFVLGQGWRWLAPVYFQNGKSLAVSYNNFSKTLSNFTPIEYNRWYEIAVSYDLKSKRLRLFLDRQQIVSDTATLDTNNDDSFVLWCNCGSEPMRGYWRQLRIYGPGEMTTSTLDEDQQSTMKVFPNPARDQVHLKFELASRVSRNLEIYDPAGALYQSIEVEPYAPSVFLDISHWPNGVYQLKVGSYATSLIKL